MWLNKTADYILKYLEKVSGVVSKIGAATLALLMFLTATDVILRYFFDRPIIWAYEVTELLLIILVFFWVAQTGILKGHVTVDILVSRFPTRTQAIIDSITSLLSLGVLSLVAWQSVVSAHRDLISGLETMIAEIPVFPFPILLSLGCALFALVMLTNLLYSLAKVVRK